MLQPSVPACASLNANPRSRQRGFTLLELIIVMFVMGLLVAFVTLSIDPGGGNRTAEREARRLQLLMNEALQESLLTGVPWRIRINTDTRTYAFQMRSSENSGLAGRWTEQHGIRSLRERLLPPGIGFEVTGNPRGSNYYIVIDPLANIEFAPLRFIGSSRSYRVDVDERGHIRYQVEEGRPS